MYCLGELSTLVHVYDLAVQAMVRKWIANPLGPKWGGLTRPWTSTVTIPPVTQVLPTNQTMDVPDIISRLDPRRIWVRMQETCKHEVVNIGNTVAFLTVHFYHAKQTGILDDSGVYKATLMDVLPTSASSTYMGYDASGLANNAWAFVYPYLVSTVGPSALFKPLTAGTSLLGDLRRFGAQEQMQGFGQWFQPDFRQDLAANSWHATVVSGNTNGANGEPWVQNRYFQHNNVSTPPVYNPPGTSAPQFTSVDYANFWMGGPTTTHLIQHGGPNDYLPFERTLPANEERLGDYSHWPQYSEARNRFVKRVFGIGTKRIVLQPGQKAAFVIKGKPFLVNALTHRILNHSSILPQTVANLLNPTEQIHDPIGGSQYILGADWRPVRCRDGGGFGATPPDTLMCKKQGSPTTTCFVSYAVRGQHAFVTTAANRMGIVPAVCIVKKTHTVRYNATTLRAPRIGGYRNWYDNRTSTPLTNAGPPVTQNYAMQYPVTTTGLQPPTYGQFAYP